MTTFGEWTEGMTLVPGTGGAFEVTVNGKQIFSKKAEKRYPELQELKETIQQFLK